jgi:hypothetical protein
MNCITHHLEHDYDGNYNCRIPAGSTTVGLLGEWRVAVLRVRSRHEDPVIAHADLRATPITTHEHAVRLPNGFNSIIDARISPRRDEVAWILSSEREFPANVERLLAAVHIRPRNSVGIWVSKTDGSEMREIGQMEYSGWTYPRYVDWSPDAQCLSFIYDDALWTVPAR